VGTILAVLTVVAGAEPETKRYQIDVVVTRVDPSAPRSEQNRPKVLAEPRVVTGDGRPAWFRFGKTRAVLSEASGPASDGLAFDYELQVVPLSRSGGRILLEIGLPKADRVKRVELKSGVTQRFRGPEGMQIEVTATEVAAEK
jgi:hypothetical protein